MFIFKASRLFSLLPIRALSQPIFFFSDHILFRRIIMNTVLWIAISIFWILYNLVNKSIKVNQEFLRYAFPISDWQFETKHTFDIDYMYFSFHCITYITGPQCLPSAPLEITGGVNDLNLHVFASMSFGCAGFVRSWELTSLRIGGVYVSVWRPNTSGGFRLIGFNLITVTVVGRLVGIKLLSYIRAIPQYE